MPHNGFMSEYSEPVVTSYLVVLVPHAEPLYCEILHWADNSYSVNAEQRLTAIPVNQNFPDLIDYIDYYPTEEDILAAYDDRMDVIAETALADYYQ